MSLAIAMRILVAQRDKVMIQPGIRLQAATRPQIRGVIFMRDSVQLFILLYAEFRPIGKTMCA